MEKHSDHKHLLKILTEAIRNRIYGSVEIYFEEGKMTQITQRIINKIHTYKPKQVIKQEPKPITIKQRDHQHQHEVEINSVEINP